MFLFFFTDAGILSYLSKGRKQQIVTETDSMYVPVQRSKEHDYKLYYLLQNTNLH